MKSEQSSFASSSKRDDGVATWILKYLHLFRCNEIVYGDTYREQKPSQGVILEFFSEGS